MVGALAAAWKELSAEEQAEWKEKATKPAEESSAAESAEEEGEEDE